MLNNREIAIVVWLALFSVLALSKRDIRGSAVGLLKAVLRPKILAVLAAMVVYNAVAVGLLWGLRFWNAGLVKDTILWCVFIAVSLVFRFCASENRRSFWPVIVDCLRVMVVVEFLVSRYPFSLLAELLLVPVVGIIVAWNAFVTRGLHKDPNTARVTSGLLAVIGLGLIFHAMWKAVSDFQDLATIRTLKVLTLPLVLGTYFLPFLYLVTLIVQYGDVFLRLDMGSDKSVRLKRYARLRIEMHCGLSVKTVRSLLSTKTTELMHIQTTDDVNNLFC